MVLFALIGRSRHKWRSRTRLGQPRSDNSFREALQADLLALERV